MSKFARCRAYLGERTIRAAPLASGSSPGNLITIFCSSSSRPTSRNPATLSTSDSCSADELSYAHLQTVRSLYQVCADIAALAASMCVRGMRNHGLAQIETSIGQRDFKFFRTLRARRQGKPGRLQYRAPDSCLPSTRSMSSG